MLSSGHLIYVTYYGEISIEPFLTPEFDVDHDFEVKNGCFQSLFLRVLSVSEPHSVTSNSAKRPNDGPVKVSKVAFFAIFAVFSTSTRCQRA